MNTPTRLDARSRYAFPVEITDKIVDVRVLLDNWCDRLTEMLDPSYDEEFMEHADLHGDVGHDQMRYARGRRAEDMAAEIIAAFGALMQDRLDRGELIPWAYAVPDEANIEIDPILHINKTGAELNMHYPAGQLLAAAARLHHIVNADFYPESVIRNLYVSFTNEVLKAQDHKDAFWSGAMMGLVTDEADFRVQMLEAVEARLDKGPIRHKHLAVHKGGQKRDLLAPEREAAKPMSAEERAVKEDFVVDMIDMGYRYTPKTKKITPQLVDASWPCDASADPDCVQKSARKPRAQKAPAPAPFKPKA